MLNICTELGYIGIEVRSLYVPAYFQQRGQCANRVIFCDVDAQMFLLYKVHTYTIYM